MQVKTGSYTGNGVDTRGITGIGFQPHVVIVKRMNGSDGAMFRHASMAAGKSMTLRNDSGVVDNCVESLDSYGFTVGTDNTVNLNTATYSYIAIRDNGSGDFKYGTYTGNGTDNRSITGVGFQPNWIVVKGDGGRTGCFRSGTVTGDATHAFYSTGTQADQIQAIQSDGFQVGTSDFVNANLRTYYYFAFKEVADFCESFSYTGNGTDNRDITTPGFQPGLVWIKHETGSDPRFRTSGHTGDASQSFDGTQAANDIQGFISTGFTIGNNSQVNTNTATYHALALKDGTSSSSTVNADRNNAALAILAPIVTGAAIAAASLFTQAFAVQSPLASGQSRIAPLAFSQTLAVQPVAAGGAGRTLPNNLSSSVAVRLPEVSGGGANALVNTVNSSFVLHSPAVIGGAVVNSSVQSVSTAIQAPSAGGAGSTSVNAQIKSLAVLSPSVSGSAEVQPATRNASLAIQTPVVTVPVAPNSLASQISVLSPQIRAGAAITPSVVTVASSLTQSSVTGRLWTASIKPSTTWSNDSEIATTWTPQTKPIELTWTPLNKPNA
jgi:hypothetical protein